MERKNSTEWNTVIRKVNRAGQMGCTFGLDMYIGTLCIGDWDCDKASSITHILHEHRDIDVTFVFFCAVYNVNH